MTVPLAYREVRHAERETRRFLSSTKDLFTTRSDQTRWPRWKNTWSTANAYFTGLLVPGLKNMDRIAKTVDVPVGQIEAFVRESPWDHRALQAWLVKNVPDVIQHPKAAFVVDDFGIIKQGTHSVGAFRQYSGAAGKVGNCQVAVNVTYAAPGPKRNADQKTWPLGTELYLPQAWVEDDEYADLREEVHLPDTVHFQTKPQIALTLLERAYDANLEHAVTIGDAGFGADASFRRRLRERGEPYLLGVAPHAIRVAPADAPVHPPGKLGPKGGRPRSHPYFAKDTTIESPKQVAARTKTWKQVEWARGTKGPLVARFARIRVRVTEREGANIWATDEVAWLLLEQRSNELKAYLCWGLDDATLYALVEFAHLRWTIEQFHREAKGYLGVDRFEGRSWRGWHHHVTMVLLAYAFLSQLRAQGTNGPLPTLPQTAREIGTARITLDMMRDQGLRKAKARHVAEMVVRRYTEW